MAKKKKLKPKSKRKKTPRKRKPPMLLKPTSASLNAISTAVIPTSMSSKDFAKLQKEWYGKLKDEGFDDIEHFNKMDQYGKTSQDTPYLKDHGIKMAKLYRQDVLDYFLACEDLFWQSRVFRSQRDRWFWYQHSQGLSLREIQDKHTTVTGNYLSWVTIHKRLKPYRTMVGVKLKSTRITTIKQETL